MNSKIKDETVDFLFKAILSLETMEDCYDFFEDLCTVPEIKAMSQRLYVAKLLSDKCVYSDIVNKTGASTATISRVNRALIYGWDGYNLAFRRIEKKEKEAEGKEGWRLTVFLPTITIPLRKTWSICAVPTILQKYLRGLTTIWG